MTTSDKFSLYEALMIDPSLQKATIELHKGVKLGLKNPSRLAAKLAESYNVNVRELAAIYKRKYGSVLTEAPIDDAIEDVRSEGEDAIEEIAADYGLDPENLRRAYRHKMSTQADPEMMQRIERKRAQEKEREEAERATRQAAGKKAFASKVANLVDKIVAQTGMTPYKATYEAAAVLRDQGFKLDAGQVDEYYMQARGHMPEDSGGGLSQEDKDNIVRIMMDSVSSVFPDGDPIDFWGPRIRKQYGENVEMDAINIFKEVTGQDYHDYLADFWDQVAGDTPEVVGDQPNPWR